MGCLDTPLCLRLAHPSLVSWGEFVAISVVGMNRRPVDLGAWQLKANSGNRSRH